MTQFVSTLTNASRRRRLALPLLLLLVACGVGLSVRATARPEPRGPRTIALVARGMTFYLAGDETAPNPRLRLGRGEEVRIQLRNEDPGMAHDFSVKTLGKSTKLLRQAGDLTELVLRAPARAGEHDYLCSLHPRLMRGVLEVR